MLILLQPFINWRQTSTPAPTAVPTGAPVSDRFGVKAWMAIGGTISQIGVSAYAQGQTVTYSITPAAGCRIVRAKVDGIDVGVVSNCAFKGLPRNHEIDAYFDKDTDTAGKIPPPDN